MLNLLFKIFIIFNSTVLTSITVYSKEICPRVCICDVFEGQKRADCSEQNLVSADVNLAKSVQILNLSGNDIPMIENHNFKDFVDLINLSVAKNSIHTIELFAFVNLGKLKHLDLSDNRLESLDNRIIESNEELTFLDLSKNKFMNLEDSPLLISESVEFLSLRSSHLTYIYDSFFEDMPKIVDLDISDNLLITLRISNFLSLIRLQFLNIEYNSFTCDNELEQTLKNLKHRKVFVKTDKCNKHSKKSMFEKMIMLPSLEKESKEDIEIDLVWGRLPNGTNFSNTTTVHKKRQELIDFYSDLKANREEELDCLNDEFMSSLCECRQNFMALYETQEDMTNAMKLRLYAVLYVGIFTGAICGCLLFFILNAVKKRCGSAITKQIKRQEERDRIVRNHLEDVNRRRTENSQQFLPQSPVLQNNSQLARYRYIEEPSPTAQLLHRLFRNRDAFEMDIAPVPLPRTRFVPQVAQEINEDVEERLNEQNETVEDVIERTDHLEMDELSEYASAVSSTMNIDRSCTPPPAYRSIFD